MGLKAEIVGTWRVTGYERLDGSDGSDVSYPMGRAPRGYFTYDAHGRMSVQLMRQGRRQIAAGNLAEGAPDEVREAVGGYLAYCAAYRVDEAEGSVTHEVDVHLLPNAIGSSLKRYVQIDGDRLTITIRDSREAPPSGRLTLERVGSA